jgi:transposase-like protein
MTAIALPVGAGPAGESKKDDGKPKNFPLRKRTGTAHRRLMASASDVSTDDVTGLTPREAVELMAEARWGSMKFMPCPHCGTMDEHYWHAPQLRWKCTGCGKRFSVTSATVFADHKLPLSKILAMVFSWSNPASGKTAMDLRWDWKVSYRTAFTLAHKLREGLVRGFNVGLLCGVQEMDGADLNGKRYKEKRNKPLGGGGAPKPKIPAHLLKPEVDPTTGEIMGPPKPPKFDKASKQPEDRRLMLVMRQRGMVKKRGAVATRISIALTEAKKTVVDMAQKFASAESRMMSDEDPAYATFATLFAGHGTVNHSKTYSAPGGVNNNQAESFNRRMRRAAQGIYLCPSNKYLTDYACEAAWREDMREVSKFDRLKGLPKTALGVGLSEWWRGYWQGQYRTHELLIEGPKDAKGRGRKKGWKAKPPK